jgi:hypothetical protein
MKTLQKASRGMWLVALLLVAFGAGCNDTTSPGLLTTIVVAPSPATLQLGATQQFTAVFKDAAGVVITTGSPTWSVAAGGGTISAAGLFTAGVTSGTFANTVKATSGTVSGTATVIVSTSTGNGGGTGTGSGHGPAVVPLGTAGTYVILAKSGVANTPTSAITGDIGVSPIDHTGITGFPLTPPDATATFSTTPEVTGKLYAADYVSPTPGNLTTAIGDMMTAYTTAAGRTLPDYTDLGAGNIGGLTLAPGLYKWGTGVLIPTSVTLSGTANDTWIFQIAGGITQSSATSVILTGGALAANVVWQVFGAVAIGTTAHFEGRILSQTSIVLGTGASVNGRLFAQTAVTLAGNTVVAK